MFSCQGQIEKVNKLPTTSPIPVATRIEKVEYAVLLKKIIEQRDTFKKEYDEANLSKKKIIVNNARNYLTTSMANDIFPYWYGTEWDFNGMTRTPNNGKIACGYFITNTLTDVGFNIPRIGWAQSASEKFIKKLSPSIKKFSNKTISKVKEYLLKSGDGLYIVGLDMHTGFIFVQNGKVNFIHSNYYYPEIGVMSEDIKTINPLSDSKYRIIGKLMSDVMVINWINNSRYHMS